jgi:hypothetical protein
LSKEELKERLLNLLANNQEEMESVEDSIEQPDKRMTYRYGKRMTYRYGKRGAMPYRFGKRSFDDLANAYLKTDEIQNDKRMTYRYGK